MQDFKLLVLGGDLRTAKMAESLAKDGYNTSVFATANENEKVSYLKKCSSLQEGVKKADVIILGLPCTRDDITIEAPFYEEKISFKELFQLMSDKILIAGKVSEKLQMKAREYGIKVIDYFDREELTVLNAIPTAEGALEIAMRELPITIHSSNSLVLGFGRIGKIISRLLSSLGSNVTVSARKHEDLAWINAYSYKSVHSSEILETLPYQDVIINTVPYPILNRKELSSIKRDCLIIDLASKPGGVDFEAAKELDAKVIWALSLPWEVTRWQKRYYFKNSIFFIPLNFLNFLTP